MNEKIFWVWNGWGLLFTGIIVLSMFLYILLTEKMRIHLIGGTLIRNLLAWVDLAMIILSFIFSGWVAGLLAFPLGIIGGVILAWCLIPPKHYLKHYIPIVAIGLAIWGLFTLDWFQVGFGVILWIGAYLFDLSKKKGVMKDDKVFAGYRSVSDLIRIIRKSILKTNVDLDSSKAKLAQGLFFMGMIDAASQSLSMSENQFLQLYKAIFYDLDFEGSIESRILLFHQSLDTEHKAFPVIMKGGELYTKFINGNTIDPLAGCIFIEELIGNPAFPNSVDEL